MNEIRIRSLADTDRAAAVFLDSIGNHRIIAFSGELGAGKTTFIQALCRALGVPQVVSSPTFSLINEYFDGQGESIYHFDLYRINDPVELLDIGYEDYLFSGAYCFIEWPEKGGDLIPEDALRVTILVQDSGERIITRDESS